VEDLQIYVTAFSTIFVLNLSKDTAAFSKNLDIELNHQILSITAVEKAHVYRGYVKGNAEVVIVVCLNFGLKSKIPNNTVVALI